MKKTSLYLDDDLDRALARRAAEEGVTKAELVRRILAGAVQRPRRPKPSVGVATDWTGPADVADRDEHYLGLWGFGDRDRG